jgi:TrmH family RNA methyltransferase
MSPLTHIRFVLVRPTHPGNIGASARAMKTMGLGALWLVRPCAGIDSQARALAAGADDVLERAVECDSLDEALRDCRFVLGTSARARRLDWPVLEPREAVAELRHQARQQSVAVLFGQERTGLTNEELDRCHAVVRIPTDPDFSSLNVAAALQIIAYEIYSSQAATPASGAHVPARTPVSHDEMRLFYRHLEEVITGTGFLDPAKPRLLMRRLVRLFNRARPDANEINILRGILTSVQRPFPPRK